MAFYHRLLLFPAGFLFFALGGNSQGKTFLLILFYFPLENCVNLHVFCQEVNEKTKLDAKIILILQSRMRYKKVQISLYSIEMIIFHNF